ncbi:MAG TPA: hypothetical protein VMH06_03955, partial [Thermodesulfovibrionales bacterium]|nr:hypothetical protein [Thermodesulfovibrionales bacterium]
SEESAVDGNFSRYRNTRLLTTFGLQNEKIARLRDFAGPWVTEKSFAVLHGESAEADDTVFMP